MATYTINEEEITVVERDISRSQTTGPNRSVDLIYAAWGSEEDASIKDAILQEAPAEYDGLVRQTVSLDPEPGGAIWKATVRYGKQDVSASTNVLSNFRFDTTRETIRLFQAPTNTTKRYAKTGETAPDRQGIIGWDGEAAQGVEIGTGAFRFSVLRRFTDSEVDTAYLQTLSRKAFSTNEAAFWIWDIGEVLYEGASGGRTGGGVTVEQGDDNEQLSGYEGLTGVSADNTDNGRLYVSITDIVGLANVEITFFKDSALTDKVAEVALGTEGINTVTPANSSGMGGTIVLDQYVADTDSIVVDFPFPWEITLQFAVSENLDTVEVGDLQDVTKSGWEYLDVFYQDEPITIGGNEHLISRPKYAYAWPLYPSLDFDLLKAGDNPFA